MSLSYEDAEKLALRAIHDTDGRGLIGRGRDHLHQRVARALLNAARSHESERVKEAVAKAIYEQWSDRPGYVPWVEGGNSDKQDDARRIARSALSAIPGEAVLAGEGNSSVGFQPCADKGPQPCSPEALRSDGWRTIDSAPRDGSPLLAASTNHDACEVVCWQDGVESGSMSGEPEEGWVNAGPIKDRFYANPRWFTHWMPLPPEPTDPSDGVSARQTRLARAEQNNTPLPLEDAVGGAG